MNQANAKSVFLAAIEQLSSDHWPAFLEQACQGDEHLRAQVEKLLRGHQKLGDFHENAGSSAITMLSTPLTDESVGTWIGRYKLREQVGEGGFGVVYVAEQAQPVRRKVALKIIKPGMDTKEVIARFEAERQALAVMNHPNVARVLDAGATETGRPYFVMELVHGIPITEFCDQQKLANTQRLELFIEVCRAVQHAHQKGIIHRDLKPSNILVTMHDDRPVPKVIDFGIAKALTGKLTEKTVYTSYDQMLGTPLYMSPEQTQMNGLDVDTRSDVYSLGVLLYVLLTGTTPFDAESLKNVGYDELRRMIREDDPPCPSARISTLNKQQLSTAADRRKVDERKLGQSLSGELDWIVMKALEKDRTRRYESASSLAEDVENYLNDQPVQAYPPSLVYRFCKFARRNKTALTTSSLVALALMVGTIVSTWLAVRAMAAEADVRQERRAAIEAADRAEENEQVAKLERDAAILAREKLRRVLYASELNRAQSAWEAGSYRRVMQILESTRPKPGETDLRGFEWHFWNRRLHGPLETQVIDLPQAQIRSLPGDTLSSDGSTLAVQHEDGHDVSVGIYDVESRKETCRFQLDHGAAPTVINSMDFSPDGRRLAILHGDRKALEIRDARAGKRLAHFQGNDWISDVLFSRDGKHVVFNFATFEEGKRDRFGYAIWDLKSDEITVRHMFADDVIAHVQFLDPDGRKLGVRSYKRPSKSPLETRLQILDGNTAKILKERTFAGHVSCEATSFESAGLAVRVESLPDQILILDSRSLETLCTLGADKYAFTEMLLSHDGRLVAAATRTSKVGSTRASKILIWSLDQAPQTTISPLLTLHIPDQAAHLRFRSDGKQLRALILDRIWTWKLLDKFSAGTSRPWSNGAILGGSFNRDGTRAVLRTEPAADFQQAFAVLVWDVEADREIWRRQAPDDRAFAIPVLAPDGRYVVVPSRKRQLPGVGEQPGASSTQLHVLDGQTGHEVRVFKPAGIPSIDDVVFAPDGRHVAVLVTSQPEEGDLRGTQIPASFQVVLWNLLTGETVFAANIDDHNPGLGGFTPEGKELLVGLQAGGLLVLDATSGASRRIMAPTETTLHQSAKWRLSPDGKTLALVGLDEHSQDVTVTLFAAESGAFLRQIPVDGRRLPLGICWSPDNRRIALVSEHFMRDAIFNNRLAGQITIWDVGTGRLLLTLNREGLAIGRDRAICFSPDNHRLLHIAADNRFEQGKTYSYLHPIHSWVATPLPSAAGNP